MATHAALNGTVFYDLSEDGAQQGADPGVAGLLIELFTSDGKTLVASTVSASSGLYSFAGVAPGNYLLMIAPPSGDVFSASGGAPGLPDSSVLSTGGKAVTLAAGMTTTVNAGVYSPKMASVTGTVFTDANGDGRIDGADKGVGAVTVQLLNSADAVVATTVTASDGTYAFSNVAGGVYSEHVVAPSRFVPGAPVTGASNLLVNGSFEQSSSSVLAGLDGGYFGWTESASTASEPYGSGPGLGPEIQVTDGSSTGRYGVDASPDTQDAAYSGTHAAYFVDDGAVETISQTVTLVAGQAYEIGFDLDEPVVGAGNPGDFSVSASIGGQIVTTAGSAQLAGNRWTHFSGLFDPASSGTYVFQITYSSGVVGSTLAAKDVLLDDAYVRAGQLAPKLTATSQVHGEGTTGPVTVIGAQTVSSGGAVPVPPPAFVSGTLFNDVNDDGVEDGSDKGLAGDAVVLYSGATVVAAAVTDANGDYSFTGLIAGDTYSLRFAAPGGTVFSPVGSLNGATDSIVTASGERTIVQAASGGMYTVDAGVHMPISISGLSARVGAAAGTTIEPFGGVTVNAPDPGTSASVVIRLAKGGVATDADGLLSGSGLVRTGVGTYLLSASTPAALSASLRDLIFTPAAQEAAPGAVTTSFTLTATQGSASASASMSLTETATCFLAGTHILTAQGEVVVESLVAGDSVATLRDGVIVHVPVRWVGVRHLDAATVRRTGIRPVRIRAGAFSDGVPHRDLLVTPEHCILVEERLVPVRMLVNEASIFEDRSIDAFTFHHVELEAHGVLLAEGLTAESYLDTGNRGNFAGAPVTALVADFGADGPRRSWAVHACAPLATDRETVEPIWRRLRMRAVGRDGGVAAGEAGRRVDLSDDPRLRVLLDDGEEVMARWGGEGRHFFRIPTGAKPMRLLSRASVPADAIGPFVDDRRSLGVQVRSMVFWRGLLDTVVMASELELEGWHAEEDGLRWTDGAGRLDLPRAGVHETFLEIHVVGSMMYAREACLMRLAA